jgi:hypothetical protein
MNLWITVSSSDEQGVTLHTLVFYGCDAICTMGEQKMKETEHKQTSKNKVLD